MSDLQCKTDSDCKKAFFRKFMFENDHPAQSQNDNLAELTGSVGGLTTCAGKGCFYI